MSKRFISILDIPERAIGSYQIRHLPYKSGAEFYTANTRNVMMGGADEKKDSV